MIQTIYFLQFLEVNLNLDLGEEDLLALEGEVLEIHLVGDQEILLEEVVVEVEWVVEAFMVE